MDSIIQAYVTMQFGNYKYLKNARFK